MAFSSKTEGLLKVSEAPKETRGQGQPAFSRTLVGGEPTTKGMMIYANSGGHDDLALFGIPEVSFQNGHQLIWTRGFDCCC